MQTNEMMIMGTTSPAWNRLQSTVSCNLTKVKNIPCAVNNFIEQSHYASYQNNLHSAEGHRRKKGEKRLLCSTITLLAIMLNKENSVDRQVAEVNDEYCNLFPVLKK